MDKATIHQSLVLAARSKALFKVAATSYFKERWAIILE